MKSHKRRGTLLCLVLVCVTVQARDLDQDEALSLRQSGTILPLEQLMEMALARHPGARLLEAELEEKHGVYVYEFEILTQEGVVRELKYDARDSRLLKDEED
jgi:uncharacterized membrane protein YkoI